ncbi:MraY family glycosyltransferase [Algoriphagus terrigena]|uniref:MraY family glycosyltransferase n=1 Tax=Algoriphagus terrigena TaxID=344884 RepID=UPI0003FD12C7|nr:glycosyltransferase family 4 protein [Algoriphagus terrigena]
MFLSHSIVFLLLLLLALIYYRLAIRFGIVDRPNHRSSHTRVTVRGGGIIFPFAVILWWMAADFIHTWMVLGLVWISAISLLDDIYNISRKLRFGIQFLALNMAFYDLGVFEQLPLWSLPFLYFAALGILNAVNFMDGINGIAGLCALCFFGSILAVNRYMPIFDNELIYSLIMGVFVFLIFNFRKNAMMFAGDIGSISLAYMMIYFLVQWFLAAQQWTIVLFLVIYGADAFLTLVRRLLKKENVGLPHRTHLYQILANQMKKDHVLIALAFALLQFAVNFFLFIKPHSMPSSVLALSVLVAVAAFYLAIKVPLQKKFGV